MSKHQAISHDSFTLPPSIVSKIDVSRLVDEVEQVDVTITTTLVRNKSHKDEQGDSEFTMPTISDQLSDFLRDNELSLENGNDRSRIVHELRLLKDKVPVINITLATKADRESLQQLVSWFRTEADPQAVLAVGLQPGLIAGAYVRTPNKVHDMSMRAKLKAGRAVLLKELETYRGSK